MYPVPRPRSVPAEPLFDELMAEQLRRAPWLALSVLIHALAVLIAMLLPRELPREERRSVQVERPPEDEPLVEEVEPEVEPVPEEVEDEPVLRDAEVDEEVVSDEVSEDFSDEPDVDVEPQWSAPLGLGGGGDGLRGDRGQGRARLGRRGGRDIVVCIEEGLQWLRAHQDADGRWDADEFMKHDPPESVCDGPGNAVHDVGVTALALLAFLGDGSTLRTGPDRDVVKRATRWLLEQQQPSGLFGTDASHDFVYDHAIAALAVAEAYGLSRASILRRPAQAGLAYLEAHRNPYMVWRYQPRDLDNDSSVTGWCLMAYKTGVDFDLQVNRQALKLCQVWFDDVTDPVTGACGYTKRGEPSSRHRGDHGTRFPPEKGEALTAVGLASRFFLGQDPRDHPVMLAAADRLLASPPTWDEAAGTIDHYYWYYATYALYQMGGRHWKDWSRHLKKAIVDTRRRDGSFRGSWDPVGAWGEDGGRVYSTAILVLTLEAYYRYTRVLVR